MGIFFDWLRQIFQGTVDVPSPSHVLPDSSIRHSPEANLIIISLGGILIPFTTSPKVWLTTVQDTNSMDPLIDIGMTCILVAGADEMEQVRMLNFLKVGEVWVNNSTFFPILHSLLEIC